MSAHRDPPAADPAFAQVFELLRQEPWSFSFFQAVSMLELLSGSPPGRLGKTGAGPEPVRFQVHPSLAFPASEIQSLDMDASPPRMEVNFFGLTGPDGILPHFYTTLSREHRGRALRDFLDILHHRMLALLYGAWRKFHLPPLDPVAEEGSVLSYLLGMVGLGTPGLRGLQSTPDRFFGFHAGLFSLEPRSALALENILRDYFQAPVVVEQFAGAWYPLDEPSLCSMDDSEDPSEQLGLGAVVGDEIWDYQFRARIRLGPLTRRQYEELLPGRPAYRDLRAITRYFSGDAIEFEAQLILEREEVPAFRMDAGAGLQLGWTTWISTRPAFPRDAQETVFLLE